MANRLFCVVLALIAAIGQPAAASELSKGTRELGLATIDQNKLASAEGRLALVNAVKAYCSDVQATYPTNSPSEEQWISSEMSGDVNRMQNVMSSPEMGRRFAKVFTDQCVSASDWAIKQPEKSVHLVILAHSFIRFASDAEYFGKKNGVDVERYSFKWLPRSAAEALAYAAIMIEAK